MEKALVKELVREQQNCGFLCSLNMSKHDYKRYKEIREEIAQLEQDQQDTLKELQDAYVNRDRSNAKMLYKRLEIILNDLNIRETIRHELLLPKYAKIEDGMSCLESFWQDNDIEPNDEDIEEFAAMYLNDNFNHNVYGFNWVVKGRDIYITSIRWNEKQILKSDLKQLFKGKIRKIENWKVRITKHPFWEHTLVIVHKDSTYVQSANTLNKAIRILEDHYYM